MALCVACQRQPPVSLRLADGRPANLLLVTIDTLRADHLGCYAPAGPTLTPNIDALAARAALFEHASAAAPVTQPSLASLLTGRYPGSHPVRFNGMRLPGDVPVLAESLAAAGYGTGAFYGNVLLAPGSGLERGFQAYTSFVSLAGPSDARGAEQARGWLSWPQPEPWFLWVHFMDPHGPYQAEPLPRAGGDSLPDTVLPVSPTNYGLGVIPKYQALPGLDRARDYRSRYRGEVRFTDEQVGRLLATLDQLDLRQRTVVVLTADHGESLGEHDLYFQHGWFLFDDSARVPLLVHVPGVAPRRVSEPVSLVDLMPTILAGLDLPVPAGVEGRDLRPALAGTALPPAPVFAVSAYLNQLASVRLGSWKLIHTPGPPREQRENDPWAAYYARQPSYALYDLATDPAETSDLSLREPDRAAELRALLTAWESAHGIPYGRPPEVELDPATREHMGALGYGD